MPFGLTNAPSTFQSLMNDIFWCFLRKSVLVFFDDILVYSKDQQEHLRYLCMVLLALRTHTLFAKRSKCVFPSSQVEYLGHVITVEGVSTNLAKVVAASEWPVPRNMKELHRFLGLIGYYRHFVKNYEVIAKPLTDLLKKDNFSWTSAATNAFEQLKRAMTTTPGLALLDFTKSFVIEMDACGEGASTVLLQEGQPIAFMSKAIAAKHQALSIYQKELMAIVLAVQKWTYYLLGCRFIICTDHQSLKHLLEQRLHIDGQLKWLTKLMGYDYEICYRCGKENVVADALSQISHAGIHALTIATVQPHLLEKIQQGYRQTE